MAAAAVVDGVGVFRVVNISNIGLRLICCTVCNLKITLPRVNQYKEAVSTPAKIRMI